MPSSFSYLTCMTCLNNKGLLDVSSSIFLSSLETHKMRMREGERECGGVRALVHVSSCRRITWSWHGSEDPEPRLRAKFSSLFARRLGAGSHSSAGFGYKKMNGINVVAHKAVPGGPNPLHN
ncbi:hypothetical protein DVH24_022569 [Malus domestica]|uniref:Uncharacterized protein n=1 Tax=Malus domestica TaxID=3750 RepID=A0A498KRV0_MALDO|nr:hypothetical protein DVH24_022569 [Malus domestica]